MQDQEKKLQNYREKNSGQMPTQADRNMLALQNTWQNIQATVESINHDKERRLVLERQLADLTAETPADAPAPLTRAKRISTTRLGPRRDGPTWRLTGPCSRRRNRRD
jgi:hypothetical protein